MKNQFLLLFLTIQVYAIPPSHKKHNRLHSTTHSVHIPTTVSSTTQSSSSTEPSQENSTAVQPMINDHFVEYDTKHRHYNLNMTSECEISSCFGKIKTSLSLNPNFRAQFDKVVKVSRLDQIESLIGKKVVDLCTHDERAETDRFMRLLKPASQIANEIYRTLTNDERDHLNVWSNLNDTDSEQKFYLAKFNALPASKYEEYNAAFNSVMGRFLNSTMKIYINKFLSQLKEKDFKQMEVFAREDSFDSIRNYIRDKLKNGKFTAAQKSEIENFFANSYNKASIVTGTGLSKMIFKFNHCLGTRQYELKHGSSYEDIQWPPTKQ